MKHRMWDLMSKFNAPGVYPCPIGDLQVLPRHFGGPGTNRQQLESWWGDNVFHFIRERMEVQKTRRGIANWDMHRAIQNGGLMMAGVRSDGGHGMQENPTADPAGHATIVWPTIVFRCSNPCPGMANWWSYCQGLALMDGASPWACHFNALEFYGPCQAIVDVPIPIDISQSEIEELEIDEESMSYGSSESSASTSSSVEVVIPL